jgi:hypothetical protein
MDGWIDWDYGKYLFGNIIDFYTMAAFWIQLFSCHFFLVVNSKKKIFMGAGKWVMLLKKPCLGIRVFWHREQGHTHGTKHLTMP